MYIVYLLYAVSFLLFAPRAFGHPRTLPPISGSSLLNPARIVFKLVRAFASFLHLRIALFPVVLSVASCRLLKGPLTDGRYFVTILATSARHHRELRYSIFLLNLRKFSTYICNIIIQTVNITSWKSYIFRMCLCKAIAGFEASILTLVSWKEDVRARRQNLIFSYTLSLGTTGRRCDSQRVAGAFRPKEGNDR